MKVNHNDYPTFSGNVVSVSGFIEANGEIYSIVNFFTQQDKEEVNKTITPKISILTILSETKLDEVGKELEKKVSRVAVPMRLDPEILRGANVRAKFGKIGGRKTYEVEIIRGRVDFSGDPFADLAQHHRPNYTGFKYIKFLDGE